MKLNLISRAAAAAFGVVAGSSFALPASDFDGSTVNIRVSGATALDNGLFEAVLDICKAGTLHRYTGSNQAVFFCRADGTKIGLADNTKLAVYKHSVGGSGNGEAIVANRVKGVRCGLCWNEQVAIWNRSHNDANVLSLGQRTVTEAEALHIVKIWLATPFEGGRHVARVNKIDAA